MPEMEEINKLSEKVLTFTNILNQGIEFFPSDGMTYEWEDEQDLNDILMATYMLVGQQNGAVAFLKSCMVARSFTEYLQQNPQFYELMEAFFVFGARYGLGKYGQINISKGE